MADAPRYSISESSSEHQGPAGDEIDDYDLQQRVEKIEREIIELRLENEIFETNLERKKSEPISMVAPTATTATNSSQATTPTGSYQDLSVPSGTARNERLARKRSKSRSTQGDFRIQLTLEQKLDIIMAEYEHKKNEKNRKEATVEKKIDSLESDLEWIDAELSDFEAAITDLLKNKETAIDSRTRKLIGEKIDRYFHERLKSRESLINKLRDRSSGLKRQIVRLEAQLRQKEEMGETLHEVDFNQLKIENKQYLDKIDEKNLALIDLKSQVGRVTQTLNRRKDDLQTSLKALSEIELRTEKQIAIFHHSDKEMIKASSNQSVVARRHHELVEQTENYQVPEVLDYVKKKALLYNLQRDCEVWERKVEIASMALQQSKQKWQTLQRNAQFQNQMANWNQELNAH